MSAAGRGLRERIGRDDQLGGIMPLRLENGVRAARIQTLGGIDALVILDRAMDIAHCSFLGVPLVWHGAGGILPAHPGTLSEDEFQRRFFGGLLTTCGLEAFGPAGSDEFGTWGPHGHVNHIAAEEITTRDDFGRAGTVPRIGRRRNASAHVWRIVTARADVASAAYGKHAVAA